VPACAREAACCARPLHAKTLRLTPHLHDPTTPPRAVAGCVQVAQAMMEKKQLAKMAIVPERGSEAVPPALALAGMDPSSATPLQVRLRPTPVQWITTLSPPMLGSLSISFTGAQGIPENKILGKDGGVGEGLVGVTLTRPLGLRRFHICASRPPCVCSCAVRALLCRSRASHAFFSLDACTTRMPRALLCRPVWWSASLQRRPADLRRASPPPPPPQ
jgi:hypothetical protein